MSGMAPAPHGVRTGWARPSSVADACRRLALAEGRARPAAGCSAVPLSELVADQSVDEVIDLAAIPELRGIDARDGAFRIGAMTTLAELGASEAVSDAAPMLAAVAGGVADEVLRSVATVGGNVAPRVARQLELPTALVALDATLEIAGPSGRTAGADELCDPEFGLAGDELIEAISVPTQDGPWAYRKLTTNLDSYGIGNVAIALGSRARAAAALGESIPQRLPAVEEALAGGDGLDTDDAKRVALAATEELRAIDDALASAEYRRRGLAAVLAEELVRVGRADD